MLKIFFIIPILAVFAIGLTIALGAGTFNQAKKNQNTGIEKATFAGGCFWCMEPPFEKLDGVKNVVSGYSGGEKKNPTYEEVSYGVTGHVEAIQVLYDPKKISYSKLLEELKKSGKYKKPIATKIVKFEGFYKAEDYHQDYYKKNPLRYKLYRSNSG